MDSEKEIWVDVKGYEGLYQVSNLGNVKSVLRSVDRGSNGVLIIKEKILKFGLDKFGYYHVNLSKNGKAKTTKVHRLVAIHFLYDKLNNNDVNHIDSNKLNNIYANLEWVSRRENCTHREINKNWTSNYVGVYKPTNRKKWRSSITHNGKFIHIGNYNTEIEAYNARVEFEKENGIINKYL